jgi:D-3-phosphoglycerate dehydrogenase
MSLLVAVADSVFPNLDVARSVVSAVGAELALAADASKEAILATARGADALLVTYAKITGDMIGEMKKCRIISRFGIGVDNVDLEAATAAGIVVTKVPDYWRCGCRSCGRFPRPTHRCTRADGR